MAGSCMGVNSAMGVGPYTFPQSSCSCFALASGVAVALGIGVGVGASGGGGGAGRNTQLKRRSDTKAANIIIRV
jgi:hypothetical protein